TPSMATTHRDCRWSSTGSTPRTSTGRLLVPELVPAPARIPVPGGKVIDEYVGRASTGTDSVSVAHMVAPGGWSEPPQTPDFDEVTVVLRGAVLVEHDGGVMRVPAGQAVLTRAGER